MSKYKINVSKKEMNKFKIGDKVICVENIKDKGTKGAGWRKNLIFKVSEITSTYSDKPIYWKGLEGCGVYENYLELVTKLTQSERLKRMGKIK